MTRNPFLSHGIDEQLMCALDMVWIGGVVSRVTEYAVREFRDSAYHEMVNIM